MSIDVMNKVWAHAPYDGGTLLVLLALADWSNDEGQAWPSVAGLARKARLGERQTRSILRALEADGVLNTQPGGGRRRQNSYQINTAIFAPFEVEKGQSTTVERGQFDAQRGQSTTEKGHSTAPDPLVEPSVETSVPPNPQGGQARVPTVAVSSSTKRIANRPTRMRALGGNGRHGQIVAVSPLSPDFLVAAKPLKALLLKHGFANVPEDELALAVDAWRRDRIAKGQSRADWQADAEGYVLAWANNHWREKEKPGGSVDTLPDNYHFWSESKREEWNRAHDYDG